MFPTTPLTNDYPLYFQSACGYLRTTHFKLKCNHCACTRLFHDIFMVRSCLDDLYVTIGKKKLAKTCHDWLQNWLQSTFSTHFSSKWFCCTYSMFCLDVNECKAITPSCGCAKDDGICKATCINTPGSYHCKCPKGYRLNSAHKCEGKFFGGRI